VVDWVVIWMIVGGVFVGDLVDGIIKLNFLVDYVVSGFWDSLFGDKVFDIGNLDFVKKLIVELGEFMFLFMFDYGKILDIDK